MIIKNIQKIRNNIYKDYNPWLKYKEDPSIKYFICIRFKIGTDHNNDVFNENEINLKGRFEKRCWGNKRYFQFYIKQNKKKETFLIIMVGLGIQIIKVLPSDFDKFDIVKYDY